MPAHDNALLNALEDLPRTPWRGPVWRHMFNDYTPDRVNTTGGRWNPAGVEVIYAALERHTALAEGQHQVDVQPRRTYARRVLYQVQVSVSDLIDLTTTQALSSVGLIEADLTSDDFTACQRIGAAAAWLGAGGLLVPSARADGDNIVIIVTNNGLEDDLNIITSEVIDQPDLG